MITVAVRGAVRSGLLGRGSRLFGGGELDGGRRGALGSGLLVEAAVDCRLVMLVHQFSPQK
jgi:hypothetical protein